MAFVVADRVAETSTTTGTGTYSLAGVATGFGAVRTFVAGVGNGNTTFYAAYDDTGWEVGIGTVTDGSPDTLARTSVLASSNSNNAVNWGAGTRTIIGTLPAAGLDNANFRAAIGLGTASSPQFTGIELGHASDTTLTRVSAGVIAVEGSNVLLASNIGSSVQAYDADTLKGDVENQTITGGGTVTSKSLGTISSGTLTLDMGDRPLQHYTANGAHTLAPGSVNGACILDVINGASAGNRTLSGWTKVEGSFDNVNGNKFRCHCSVGQQGSLLIIQALQ